jgi:hypothetical protein
MSKIKRFEPGAGHLNFSAPFKKNVNILLNNKFTAICGSVNGDCEARVKNIIKYIC